MSLASEGHEVHTPPAILSPTPSLGFEYEFQLEQRPQRRRRSPEEGTTDAADEAKRYCVEMQRPTAESPTFAEAVQRSPQPSGTYQPSQQRGGSIFLPPPLQPGSQTQQSSAAPKTQATTADQRKEKKRPRYPPLIVEKLPNWATHFRALAAKLGHPPNARPYGSGVRFSPESEDEYRVIQRYLTTLEKEEGVSWFAYSLPADKKMKVAILGLPADTDTEEILEELRNLGFQPEYVRHIRARQGRPGCIFHAVLQKTADARAIYDTTVLLNMRGIRIEAWRGKRGPAQCHRCQQFRHSSHQCHRPLACVRCGEGHPARECPRPRDEPATCANCGGPHPASNIKCPVFQREIKNRRAGTVAITTDFTRRPTNNQQPAEENQGTSLMATANGPTNRDGTVPSGRKKRKRGGKGRKPTPPTTTTTKKEEIPKAAPALQQAQAVNAKKSAKKSAGTAQPRQVAQTATKHADQPTTSSSAGVKTGELTEKEFTACAIKLLMGLLKAIRQGQNAGQVILDGLAELLDLYNG